MKINNIKKDKKYLDGIPLIPEPEINESDPTYYYYKAIFYIFRDGSGLYFLGHVSTKRNHAIIQIKWAKIIPHQQKVSQILTKNRINLVIN